MGVHCRRGQALARFPRAPTPPLTPSAPGRTNVAGDPCLEQVSAQMGIGLSVIAGTIGSGKSTLLQGLVEHLPVGGSDGCVARKIGEVKVETLDKRVAFCPDSPWIVNASARDNVCLG